MKSLNVSYKKYSKTSNPLIEVLNFYFYFSVQIINCCLWKIVLLQNPKEFIFKSFSNDGKDGIRLIEFVFIWHYSLKTAFYKTECLVNTCTYSIHFGYKYFKKYFIYKAVSYFMNWFVFSYFIIIITIKLYIWLCFSEVLISFLPRIWSLLRI